MEQKQNTGTVVESTQSTDRLTLNVPHVDELIRNTSQDTDTLATSQQEYDEQIRIVSEKVNTLNVENDTVTFDLDHPLHDDLVQALFDKGYSVSYSSSVTSNNGVVNRKNTATVSLNAQQLGASPFLNNLLVFNQSFNHSIKQSFNQAIIQSSNHPIKQSIIQSIIYSLKSSMVFNQSNNQSINQLIN